MKKYCLVIITLMVCGMFILGVSAVPVIVGFRNGTTVRVDDCSGVRSAGAAASSVASVSTLGTVKYTYSAISAIATDLSESEIDRLENNGDVRYIEPDYPVHILTPAMPWNIRIIGADKVQETGTNGSGVRVVVIDTGIDYTHPDLKNLYKGGYNVLGRNNNPWDDNGHGTHCSGIIAATGGENGMYGTAPGVDLYEVKVLDNLGQGNVSDVIEGITWAKDHHMQVASMSISTPFDSQALHDAVDNATENGVLIVAAAGNDGNKNGMGETMEYPAKYDSVISVAAVNYDGQRVWFSSTGSNLSVSAPGFMINSTYPGNRYVILNGTSMAAPHVAGVAALVWQAHPTWTAEQVKEQLLCTATPLGTHSLYGTGLVNASAAVAGAGSPCQ